MNTTPVLLFTAFLGLFGIAIPSSVKSFELITETEAARPDSSYDVIQRGPLAKPRINVIGAEKTTSPFSLTIEIRAYSGGRINVDTLGVWYLKNPLVDLLPRIEKFIEMRDHSLVIKIRNATAPIGRHHIVLRAEDSYEKSSEKLIRLEVVPP